MKYKELKKENKRYAEALGVANRTVCLQIDEIKRLLNVLDTEQRVNQVLENKINLEIEEKRVIFDRLKESNKQKDSYYEWYLKEIDKKNKTENKLIIGLTLSMFVITALVAIIIKGL